MRKGRFGNEFAPGLPYARGHILRHTEDDFRKCQEAWRRVRFSILRPSGRWLGRLLSGYRSWLRRRGRLQLSSRTCLAIASMKRQ